MTKVYRLETEAGIGVYSKGIVFNMGFNPDKHPLPQQDSLLQENLGTRTLIGSKRKNIPPLHFGFDSLNQMRAWFYHDEWLQIMHENGIVLSVYEAEEVYLGFSQACFNRETSTLVEKISLTEFF